MEELKIPQNLKENTQGFIQELKALYQQGLISVSLYGSAASGEFVDRYSNLNLLVVLQNTDLINLKRVSVLIAKFKMISPLFLTESYIVSSIDIFPIEFLDMQENYRLLYGKDVLKDIVIDIHNLRFQCEQELKSKLINLRQSYLRIYTDKLALRNLLFKSFTSVMHILRNVIRIKGSEPPYLKQDILKEIKEILPINAGTWEKILAAKNKQVKLNNKETEDLFVNFVTDLEKIVEIVDKL